MKEWAYMWGAKVRMTLKENQSIHFNLPHQNNLQVKLRNDMPDDMLKDAIETSRRIIQSSTDFEVEGSNIVQLILMVSHFELKQM